MFFINLALLQINNRGYLLSRGMGMVGFYLSTLHLFRPLREDIYYLEEGVGGFF